MAIKEVKGQDAKGFMKAINSKWGAGTSQILAEDKSAQILHWCSTGIPSLDDAMGWGLPGGRIVEYFGGESAGKTTALMAAYVANQEKGGINIVFDAEATFDQDRYVAMGGNPKELITIYTGTLEEFYDKLKLACDWAGSQEIPSDALVLIGVDSMPMIVPKAMMELQGDEQVMATQARINSMHLGTVNDKLAANTCLLLLNQIRDKVGSMAWTAEGNIETPGGHIIKHLCSVRVLFSKMNLIDNKKTGDTRSILGIKTGAKVVKNKVAPPLRKVQFNIMFDERGVDIVQVFLTQAVLKGWVSKGTQGKYELKKVNSEVVFKADDFAAILMKKPKWAAAFLEDCFELPQRLPDLSRYIGKKMATDEEDK